MSVRYSRKNTGRGDLPGVRLPILQPAVSERRAHPQLQRPDLPLLQVPAAQRPPALHGQGGGPPAADPQGRGHPALHPPGLQLRREGAQARQSQIR
ncbi:hypothetical protein AVEN_234901-1 [Araneus ventricosus]|uniref:Uncharacterized protein n=1 Tax=Araneus ventricosus TaxID=182803 RepID=A0A4Y2H6C1_ARAVE|nr:hypothetical protein AVEN_234901-1 [Araneus ventricosus]